MSSNRYIRRGDCNSQKMEEGAVPAFVEEAVGVICENGKEITWDDIMAFTKFRTVTEALARVKERSLDVFSYYKNERLCVTLLAKLIDFTFINPEILVPSVDHLFEVAKVNETLEKCTQSPCWVSSEHSSVFKLIEVLMRARGRVALIPYLIVPFEYDAWCSRNSFGVHYVISTCIFYNLPDHLACVLDITRPPVSSIKTVRAANRIEQICHLYGAAGDACRAMAWACGKENAGGVWYDLWVCVAERWDYRAESWESRVVSEKRLKK